MISDEADFAMPAIERFVASDGDSDCGVYRARALFVPGSGGA